MRGLDGTQGVVIPRKNVHNLMLKKDVVDAVRDGRFSIYPIDRVEEGLEIFTDMPAGEMKEDGTFPEGTIHYLVMRSFEITASFKEKKDKDKKKR
jgi:predicted ATP-dependent protease